MKKQITRIDPIQTATVAALVYAVMTLPFIVLVFLFTIWRTGVDELTPGMVYLPFAVVVVPILYGIGGFVMTAILCGVYNVVAARVGGIAFEVSERA
jgi:hypothetical protein